MSDSNHLLSTQVLKAGITKKCKPWVCNLNWGLSN